LILYKQEECQFSGGLITSRFIEEKYQKWENCFLAWLLLVYDIRYITQMKKGETKTLF
jgi:hypothetical protein